MKGGIDDGISTAVTVQTRPGASDLVGCTRTPSPFLQDPKGFGEILKPLQGKRSALLGRPRIARAPSTTTVRLLIPPSCLRWTHRSRLAAEQGRHLEQAGPEATAAAMCSSSAWRSTRRWWPRFVICAWRTNDATHDMTPQELLAFCKAVLNHSPRYSSVHRLGAPSR